MPRVIRKKEWRTLARIIAPLVFYFLLGSLAATLIHAQVTESAPVKLPRCDPAKVITADGCIKCHAQADQVWRRTPHFTTFKALGSRPEAKLIAQKMGLRSIKRGQLCVDCHFTEKLSETGKPRPVSGVSCESCHGAGKDWVPVHNDYGGPTATKAQESAVHAAMRIQKAAELGMRNPHNVYSMARSCLECHTVGNEKLVNVGGHSSGSLDFEFVSWSQGSLRHNFIRTGGKSNAKSDDKRLRVMYVAGLIADLEFSTRATAKATKKNKYGLTVAKRSADAAVRLFKIQQEVSHPQLQTVLESFAKAELKINNSKQLSEIADQIQKAGLQFAREEDGANLQKIDKLIPKPGNYK